METNISSHEGDLGKEEPFSAEREERQVRAREAELLLNEDLEARIEAGLLDPKAYQAYLDKRAATADQRRPELELSDEDRGWMPEASKRVDLAHAEGIGTMFLAGTGFNPPVDFLLPPLENSCKTKPPITLNMSSGDYNQSCSVSGQTIGLSAVASAIGKYDPSTGKQIIGTDANYIGACLRFRVPRQLLPSWGRVTLTPAINVVGEVLLSVQKPWYPVESWGDHAVARLYFLTATQQGSDSAIAHLQSMLWKDWKVDSNGGYVKETVEFPKTGGSPFVPKLSVNLEVTGGDNGKDLTVWVVPLLDTFVATSNSFLYNYAKMYFNQYDFGPSGWSGVRVPHLRVEWTAVYEAKVVSMIAKPRSLADRLEMVPGTWVAKP